MFTISNFKYDCTKKCKNLLHGDAITAALTKRSIPDDKLAAFIAKTCKNFAKICDSSRRSALYVACCVGRYAIAEWLLNHGALKSFKEGFDTWHASLGRSLWYGRIDCAALLMRYGAKMQDVNDFKKFFQATSIYKFKHGYSNRFRFEDFKSFVILQKKLPTEEYTFQNLLNEASEFDIVHDITFHVDNTVFLAHKFIVFSRSKGLMKIVTQCKDKNVYLNFTGLTAKMFELILKFIYANSLISIEDLDDMLESFGRSVHTARVDVLNIFKEHVTLFELHELSNFLETFDEELQYFPQLKLNFSPLRRTMFPDLYDVLINCANNQKIHAHKCVLIARLEYFNSKHNSIWTDTKEIDLTMIPVGYMLPIIDYLYTLDENNFSKQIYPENFLYNLIVVCDHFVISRLRTVCEIMILEELSIQNCGEILEFACSYNYALLEKGCLKFICYNLLRVLDEHSLESCQPDVLARINSFYRDTIEADDFLVLHPPLCDCVSDEKLIEFVSDFTVDLNYRMNEVAETKSKVSPKIKLKQDYENEAIRSLRRISLVDDQNPSTSTAKNEIMAEIKDLLYKADSKSNKWMKVSEQKKAKKHITSKPLKTNQIPQEENKPEEKLKSLIRANKSAKRCSKPIEAEHIDEEYEVAPAEQTVSLIDFIKMEKVSEELNAKLSLESINAKSKSPNSSRKPKHLQSFAEIMKAQKSPKDSCLKASPGTPIYEAPEKPPISNSVHSIPGAPVASISHSGSLSFSEILQMKRSDTSTSKK